MKLGLCALGLLVASSAAAQDMPLSQIIVENEGWKLAGKIVPGRVVPPSVPATQKKLDIRSSVNHPLGVYFTATGEKAVFLRPSTGGEAKRFELPLVEPSGLVLWPDGGTLVVGDAGGKHLWAFRIDKDGSLSNGDRYYPLRVRKGVDRSAVAALAMDAAGRLYADTPEGIQVFDPTGRLCGVLTKPRPEPVAKLEIGGPGGNQLIAQYPDVFYSRKMAGDVKAPHSK
jgi:SMP-30/Gluconolactonase/LRE-like region